MNNHNSKTPIKIPLISDKALSGWLTAFVMVVILITLGMIGFIIAKHNTGEKFTEFYILGITSKAQEYPTGFILDNNGKVSQVTYGKTIYDVTNGAGLVTLGIINHDNQTEEYSVKIIIDSQPARIVFGGVNEDALANIKLQSNEKWENAIGIAPTHAGDNQEVDILLFKGAETQPADSLRFFVNVQQEN